MTKYARWAGLLLSIGLFITRPAASDYVRRPSYAMSPAENTLLRQAIAPAMVAHPGRSGFRLVTQGDEALLLRIALIQAAQRSLDIQYYIMQNDVSGKLLLEAILRAADRGVRVRILVDDLTVKKSDKTWSLLDTHKNIELRVFNPFATRDQGWLSRFIALFTELGRFTRRMHNKAFIADNQVSLIGGRNLGDAYFGSSKDFNFRDVDVLAAGPITASVSNSFDRFWNGDNAFPIVAVQQARRDAESMAALRALLREHWQDAVEKGILVHLPSILDQLRQNQPPLIWAHAELAADSPQKVDQPREVADSKPATSLERLVAKGKLEFIAVSPYLVPGKGGVEWFKDMIARGMKVRILTNSLGSTDVPAVHTGYRRYRKAMLESGVDLYEMKRIPGRYPRPGRFAGSSRASLHTKIYVIDGKDIIIGTMNLDPRSVELNTELALVIHDQALGSQLMNLFEHAVAPSSSYHVIEKPDGDLEWITEEHGELVHYDREPKAGLWRRLKADLYALLPFEDQL